jgi:menaquinone-dependent protoporphyrinogen oxidase
MSHKILVTYASRAGSTVGVAQAIGAALTNQGAAVDVLPMQDVHHLADYRAVIAGSAIRMDNWLPEALQFVQRHQWELTQKPFAAFLVCLALSAQNEQRLAKARVTAASYLQPVRKLVPTLSEGLFAGALDLSKLPLHYRLAFGVATGLGAFKEGDYRDWDAIRQWADEVALKIG